MTNQEMRRIKEQLGIIDFKINYKTGVHYGIIEDFFKGKTEDLDPKDRVKIEKMLEAELKKAGK
ncbi:MAG: hypothetical protein IKR93_04505 [Firmicutes bacterium]|nr:hypothetical protein [Bacillota bacterium]